MSERQFELPQVPMSQRKREEQIAVGLEEALPRNMP